MLNVKVMAVTVIVSPCGQIVRWDPRLKQWIPAPELAHLARKP